MTKLKQKNSKMSLRKFIRALFEKETPTYIKAIIGIALVYTIFPLDVLPDIFGIIGFTDDAAVIGVLTTIAMKLLDNYHLKENQNMNNVKMVTPLGD